MVYKHSDLDRTNGVILICKIVVNLNNFACIFLLNAYSNIFEI